MSDRSAVMLLDSASLYFRAYYGVPESVVAPDGMPVNAVRGFCDMISTLLRRYRPGALVACLDYDWRPAFRVDLIPSYKAHRVESPGHGDGPDVEEVPDTLTPQVPVILAVLKAAGLCAVGAEGFEADDVIATLAHRADRPVEVVSGDRDLIGVVTDDVRLIYTGRGMARLEELDPAAVRKKYSIAARFYADFAVLRGDPSDGLPGVPGVGEKTAASLVSRFGGVEDILAAATGGDQAMTAAERKKILAAADYLAVAPAVVRGRTDLDIAELSCELPATPADPAMLAALAEQFGIASAIGRLTDALAEIARPAVR